jgi:hypothetical protein
MDERELAISGSAVDACLADTIDTIATHGLALDIEDNVVLQSSLSSYGCGRPTIAVDPTGLACTIRASCNFSYSTSPTRGLFGRCVTCNYSCSETRRDDSATTGIGCHQVPSNATWTTSVQVCSLWGTPTCVPTITDTRMFLDTVRGGLERQCSRTACRAECAFVAGVARQACKPSPCPQVCRAAASAAETVCNDVCNVWCQRP